MPYKYIPWNSALEIGHTLIDNQHKQLIITVNELFDAHSNNKGRQEVGRVMDFLVDYTIKHFDDEEELQREIGYPQYSEHKISHEKFKDTAQEMAEKLSQHGPTDDFISTVCTAIGLWVVDHIMNEDFQMAEYIPGQEQDDRI